MDENLQLSTTPCSCSCRKNTQGGALIDFQDVGTTNGSQHSLKVLSKLFEALAGRMVTDSIGGEKKAKTISVFGYILRQHSQTPTVGLRGRAGFAKFIQNTGTTEGLSK